MMPLIQVHAWRFLGFVSTVVGLVCYALSSSFHYLFGQWNLLKISLYSIFSIFICLGSLFPKVCQHPTSLLFKAHTAFLVLTITSVYSYFNDKLVNGKPDAYSLISCAAFAIMSLSLSRQTHCGFEVDLFYFFLGCFIVLVMKFNLSLAIVGVGFSYALVILRSNLATTSYHSHGILDDHSVVIDVNSQQLVRTGVDSTTHDLSEGASLEQRTNIASMMQQLMILMEEIKQGNSNSANMHHEQVKKYLEDNSELAVIDHNITDAAVLRKIKILREIAKQMFGCGFGKEWLDVYTSHRRGFVEESISRLGLKKLRIEDVHKIRWQDLGDEIERWTKVSNIAFKVIFPSERRLCDCIYFGESDTNTADISFMDICKESANQLLNFAQALATDSRSPERLFGILDVFETLRGLIPEFESLFPGLRNDAVTILNRLEEAIKGIFMELEDMIRGDPDRIAVPGGRIHPINRYVINYLRVACQSRQTLEQVFDSSASSFFSLLMQMYRIMEVLESNLEAKSKIYKDPALCYVFLMNNNMYIVRKTKSSELGTLLGNDWIRKHTAKIRQFRIHYERSSWYKILGILKLDSDGSVPPNVFAKSMKERLKAFIAQFEAICREQSSWFVFDEQLRKEMKISLEKILLPAYGNFVGRFQTVPELGKHADKYVKYGTEDIRARLNDLFQGIGA